MNRETYLETLRVKLGLWPDATPQDMDAKAIELMEAEGMTVRLDQMRDHRFRVRVFGEHMPQQTTTSTSGYPILAAYEKWQAWKAGQA